VLLLQQWCPPCPSALTAQPLLPPSLQRQGHHSRQPALHACKGCLQSLLLLLLQVLVQLSRLLLLRVVATGSFGQQLGVVWSGQMPQPCLQRNSLLVMLAHCLDCT
jgi:hypothetical protein